MHMAFRQMGKDIQKVNNTTVTVERPQKSVSAGVALLFVLIVMVAYYTFYLIFITKKLLLTAVTGKVKTYNFL